MMRIASAAPAADLLTGSAPPDDPAAASAFAAELDAATPGPESAGDPATSTSTGDAAPEAGTATVATTLAPATAAAILAHPIVLVAPASGTVETPNADAETAETAEQPLAVDLAAATPEPAESAGEDALVDAPDARAADEAAIDETTPVEVTPAPVAVAALAAADDAPAAPDTDAETEDAGSAPTPVAASPTPAATATQAAPVAASTATADRPTTEPQPSAQSATASLPSADAPATPVVALVPVDAPPVATDAAPAPTNAAPISSPAATTAPAPVAAAAPAAPVNAAPLLDQVRVPIAALRELPDGAHLVTVHVTPDELGPVTVRALVHGGSLDVQLTAPTDAAREALKALLPDLRRDLSQGGQPALLSLGDATADGAPARERDAARDAARDVLPGRGGDASPETHDPRPAAPMRAGLATLDVLA
jgi:flagellar hook-length control protein FliK